MHHGQLARFGGSLALLVHLLACGAHAPASRPGSVPAETETAARKFFERYVALSAAFDPQFDQRGLSLNRSWAPRLYRGERVSDSARARNWPR